MIDTKVARAVHALEQHRSFRIASEAIGTSQSTFSRHIAQAESLAGQTLFERTGKGITPTQAGRSFLILLKSLEEAMGQFEASSDRLRQSGPDILNIGCGPLAARSVVGPLLSETFAERPEIRSKICVTSSKDPLDALRTGALDLVVCDLTHTADIRSLEIQMLRKQEVTFWARRQHPLHARQSASISDIFSYPFATCQLPKYWQNQIATMLGGTKSAIETASRAPHIESEDFSMLASIAFFLNHQHTINVKMLKPKVIAAVSALAEFQNFRLAAEQTQNTPATFSRYIAQAEQYIGHKIFERQGKKWVLTPTGKKFLSDLIHLNGALNKFTTGLNALQRQGPQTLRIGCGPLATRAIVTSHLAEVFQRAPYIQASITVNATDAPINQLITGQLDLIVCDMTHFDSTPELEIHALATRNVTLWTRPEHPAQAVENLTLAKALKYPFVTNYLPSYWKNRLNKAVSEGAQDKIHPDFVPHFQSDDFSAAADLATRCDMICTGMPEDFEHYRQAGALVELSIQDELPWNLCVARRKEMGFPVLDLFWDRLVAN